MSLPSLSLEGKVAMITGGRRGIGKAIALMYAEAGADIAVCDWIADDGELDATVDEVRKLGRRAVGVKADVSKKAEVAEVVRRAEAELGPVDILVNNAAILGGGRSMKAFDFSEEDWDELMGVNLKSCYICAEAVGRGMMERKSGNIINIDSIEALNTMLGAASPYQVAKAGVQFLTRMLARQLGQYNIRVNSICAGGSKTEMIRGLWANPEVWERWKSQFPLGRVSETSEMASVALFLASEASSYMTGAIVVVDGGQTA